MSGWLRDIADFFFPRSCLACGKILLHNEDFLCSHCLLEIPRSHYCYRPDNAMAQLFYGKLPVERCASYFFFIHDNDFRHLIHCIKYHGEKECGYHMGRLWAQECADSGFFDLIDYIVPVPLHPKKLHRRGYNQSEWIAQGISDTTGIPLCTDALFCHTDRESQTRKGIYERWLSTHEAFEEISGRLPESCHILIVDDVVTTGATLLACGQTLLASNPSRRISMAALASVK